MGRRRTFRAEFKRGLEGLLFEGWVLRARIGTFEVWKRGGAVLWGVVRICGVVLGSFC